MSCYCRTNAPKKYCYTTEVDGRIAYRLYCTECKGFVGSKVKKEVALSCGYDLSFQDGSTTDYQCREFSKKVYKAYTDHSHSKVGLRIGFQQQFAYESYILFCPYCDEKIDHVPDWFIDWAKSSSNEILSRMAREVVSLEPLDQPIFHPKIPRPLLSEYIAYMDSKEWQRKRSARLAIDRKQCVLCGTLNNLHVHHVTYERLFNEKMSDLMTVCKSCHEVLHDKKFSN